MDVTGIGRTKNQQLTLNATKCYRLLQAQGSQQLGIGGPILASTRSGLVVGTKLGTISEVGVGEELPRGSRRTSIEQTWHQRVMQGKQKVSTASG